MKIRFNDIPEEGLTVSEEVDPEVMGLNTAEVKFTRRVRVTGTFHKERDTVLASVQVEGETEQVCARCLEPVGKTYDEGFHLDYTVREDPFLEITDDVRQEILLTYPVRFLCREDCKGLCPKCGTNLNERSCTHASS